MGRVVCVWLPNWPLQRLRHEQPELNARPIVIYSTTAGRGSRVVMSSTAAAQHGVTSGMPLAEAEALMSNQALQNPEFPHRHGVSGGMLNSDPSLGMHFEQADPAADEAALREIAFACETFTPLFGVEEMSPPESMLLDVAGCEHLFGGEQNLVDAVASDFRRRGFQVRAALAPTIGAAWAAARSLAQSNRQPVLNEALLLAALSPLPVAALRVSPKLVATLHELGLHSIGQVRALPRSTLPSRFGTELLQRLDQAFGDAPEMLVPERPREPVAVSWVSDEPLSDRESLRFVCRELLDQLIGVLKPRREGVRQLLCQFKDLSGRPTELVIGLVAASDVAPHLLELLSLQWEHITLPESVTCVRLEVTSVMSLAIRQRDLFGFETDTDSHHEVHVLLDRLTSRLGADAVVRTRLVPDAQPELAVSHEPWVEGKALPELVRPLRRVRETHHQDPSWCVSRTLRDLAEPRPLRLFSPPQPIEVFLAGPEGAPLQFRWNRRDHRVIRSWGPERIETGWWRDAPADRDYFRVEVQTGQRFWLFRCLREPTWFLHGAFD